MVRLAFLPTPSATFCMFVWIPIGITFAIYRTLLDLNIKGCVSEKLEPNKGVIFVCTHRTLLDPVFLSTF
ncbi:glycerol-3-phosphate acyltransferase, putative [Medicago truncatula]|uniref:Glycerol-3-phosphate acyltransferase, putative n=1 Tax=Medicago truncatula TaxID=3880 RepID=G7L1G1_MEDTR|nr:glycerol-3-phosphate acyltransferase, putative [Medicago truncatula]